MRRGSTILPLHDLLVHGVFDQHTPASLLPRHHSSGDFVGVPSLPVSASRSTEQLALRVLRDCHLSREFLRSQLFSSISKCYYRLHPTSLPPFPVYILLCNIVSFRCQHHSRTGYCLPSTLQCPCFGGSSRHMLLLVFAGTLRLLGREGIEDVR